MGIADYRSAIGYFAQTIMKDLRLIAVHFKLDYVNADGDISGYYPDFLVKLSAKKTAIVDYGFV